MDDLIQNGGQGNPEDLSNSEEELIVSSPITELQFHSEQLWTTDQLLEAEPCDIIEVDEEELNEQLENMANGKGMTAGGEPDVEENDEQEDTLATSGGYNYPGPFTRFEVFDDYRVYPYRAIGKLFFRRGGRSYVCSAASIGNNAIWTAGHCLHAGNNRSDGWSSRVVFVPSYKDGNAPFGQWPAAQLFTSPTWYRNGNPNGLSEDWGGAILFPKNGRKISQTVGWLGFAWNWSRFQHWNAMGYPAASPFNGRRLITNPASYAYSGSISGVDSNGIGSDMTGGSSGGPWILKFGTGNYLNGNNSYRRSNKPNEMFSPHFNSNAKRFKDIIVSKNL